jgi:hypothetical protein
METELFKTLGQVAGIGGIALGVLLILFKEIIRKSIFPTLKKDQAYRLLRLIVILIFIVAIAGISAWVWVGQNPKVDVKHGVGAGRDINVQGDIRIEGKPQESKDQ